MSSQNQFKKKIAYFGELITINLQEDPLKFICAEGIIDPTVLVCDLTYNDSSQSLEEFQKKYNLQQMSNVFRILPFMSQTEQEQFKILNESAEQKESSNKYFESITSLLKNQQVKVQNEIQSNREIMQEFMGKPLQYNQTFIFQHVKSYKYLNIVMENQTQNFNSQFQLAEYPTQSSKFQVKSCYKHMNQVCEYVCLEEDIYLISNNKSYKNWGITIDETSQENRYFNYNNLFMSIDKKQKFQLNLYRRYNFKNEERIYYGDYVWIYFPELSEFWTFNQKESSLILKDFDEDNDKYSMGLWIIEHENSNDGSVIKFDHPVRFKNMILNQYLEVTEDVQQFPRRVEQNILQSINPYIQKASISQQKFGLTDKKTEKTLFSLHKIGQIEQLKLTTKSIFEIKNIFYGINVSATFEHHLTFLTQKSEEQDIFQFIKPTTYELWESIFLAQSFRIVQFGSDTINKFIKSMNKNSVSYLDTVDDNQLSLLKQCLQKLVLFCLDADQGKSILDEMTNEANFILNRRKRKLQKAGYIKLIARLINVCFPNEQSLLYIDQINFQQQDGIKVKPIVALAKELYEVTKTCYQLLQLIIQDSQSSQLECFEIIHYFFHHFGFIKEADECLKTCLIENKELINKMYEKDLGKEYQQIKLQEVQQDDILRVYPSNFDNTINPSDNIQLLQKLRGNNILQRQQSIFIQQDSINPKYNLINFLIDRYSNLAQFKISQYQRIQFYEFLNFICISRQSGLTFIQIQVYEQLNDLKYQNIFFKYTLSSLRQNLNDLPGDGQERSQKIDVIKQYLQLMANLCFGRNYIIKGFLMLDFPFVQTVNQIVNNEYGIEEDIQEILVKILTSLHIDTKPFIEAYLPNYIFNIIQNFDDITIRDQQEIEMKNYKIKRDKTHYLDEEKYSNIIKLSRYFINYIGQPKQNQNLVYSFMTLTRKLISFKFFKVKVQEQKDILFLLMKSMRQYLIKDQKDLNNSLNQNIIVEVLRSLTLFLDIKHQENIKNLSKFFVEANKKYTSNNLLNLNDFIKQNLQDYMPKDNQMNFIQSYLKIDNSFQDPTSFNSLEDFIYNLLNISRNCNNYRINLLVFKIIFQRIYQNTSLINHLKRIQIITATEEYTVYRQIKKIITELQFEQEECEIWLEIPDSKSISDPKKIASMEKFNNLVLSLISVFFPQNYQHTQPLSHKQSVILSRQIMLRNLNAHNIIIQFIKESFYLLKTIKERNRNNSLFIDLIQNCYNFLILYMSNNNTINKQLVNQIEDIILESIDYFEIGQIEILSEIYVNNENKLDYQYQVPKDLIQRLINIIIEQKKYHTRYLTFLSIIIKNQANRINLINIIIQQKCAINLLFLNPNILQQGQDIFMLDFNKCDLQKQQPYLYHIEILKIFNNLFEENFKQTTIIQKEIKQYITFNKIIKFLCRPDIFTQDSLQREHCQLMLIFALKEQILKLFSNILQNDPNFQTLVQNSDFEFVILYFQIENEKISNLQNLRMHVDELDVSDKNLNQNFGIFQQGSLQQFRTSPDYIQSYHQNIIQEFYNLLDKSQYCNFYHYYQLSYIFPFMNSIQTQNLTQDKENQLLKVSNTYLDHFMELVNDIPGPIFQDYPGIADYISNIKEQQQDFFRCREKKLQFIFDMKDYSMVSICKKKYIQPPIYTDYLQEIIFQDKNFNLVRAIVLSIITSNDVQAQYCNQEHDFILQIITNMQDQKQFKEFIYNMMKFVEDTLSDNYYKSDLLEKEIECSKDICANILYLLKLIILKADVLGESVHIQKKEKSQKIIILEKHVTFDKLNVVLDQEPNEEANNSKDTKKTTSKYKTFQQRMQKIYVDKKILQMILKNICLSEIDNQLFLAHIDLCNCILDKGYLKAQDEIYKYFIEHKQSENLFKRIENFIKNDINNLQKPQEFNTLIFLSVQKLCNNSLNDEDNIIKLLKFVSLLTEGHYFELQEYVREQNNLDDSVNLLSIIVLFIEQLIQNISENNYYKLVQCMDTLNEFVQGQCINNQNFLAQGQLIDKIQIILEKYEQIEINYLSLYQKSQKEKNKSNQTIKYKTTELFQTTEIQSVLRFSTSYTIINAIEQPKNIQKISLSSDIQNLDSYSINQLLQRVMGNFNPDLTIKLLGNLNQYELEFEPWMIRRLQFKILIFLNSLVEMRLDQKMWKILHEKITLKVLAKNLLAIYALYKIVFQGSYTSILFKNFEFNLKKPTRPSEVIIVNGFKIYAMIQHYKRFYSDDQDFDEDEIFSFDWIKKIVIENKLIDSREKPIFFEGLNFFHRRIGYVEVLNEGRNHSVYFPILPYCLRNNEIIKENFLYQADRSNQKAKLQGLMNKSQDILTELKYQQILNEVSVYIIFSFFSKHQTLFRYTLFVLNLIQNIIILIITKNDHTFNMQLILQENLQNKQNQNLNIVLIVVETVQITVSFFLLLLFTLTRINKAQIDLQEMSLNNKNVDIINKWWFTIQVIVKDGYFYLRLIYFVFSMLGLFNFIFIAILLLEIFFQVKMLQEILLSIWRPRVQIFLLIFIFCLVQYMFAVIAYFAFYEEYSAIENDVILQSSCHGLYNCFSMMFDSTFKIDGGWTGIYNINQQRYENYTLNVKAIFDFFYVFIVLILLIDILGGLIIDTFGQLRDEFNEREEDSENFCYICGLYRRDLNKLGKKSDFEEHITKKHNIWNYLYYIAYIESKPETELSGIESYVVSNIKQSSVYWFPISNNQDEFHEFSNEFKDKFSNCQKDVTQKIDKLDDQINRIQITQQKQGQMVKDFQQRNSY